MTAENIKVHSALLKGIWMKLCGTYTTDTHKAHHLWDELQAAYGEKHRHYHNSDHLNHLLVELDGVRSMIRNWDAVLWALFYHDAVYRVARNDNEERSAALAATRMKDMGVAAAVIEKCTAIILATWAHEPHTDEDVNLFTDADLAILGASPELYTAYAHQVRREYSIYPDLLYRPGRKKVLQHFLDMQRIFKTEYFHSRYEQQARTNLSYELNNGV